MPETHLLTAKAFRYPLGRTIQLEVLGTSYDEAGGVWRLDQSDEVLVTSALRGSVQRATKKFDIETGEDQKGQ